ncbi:sigma factor-like helix-turn-helix DNA-binding protein [Campylobacterota bacterium]
MDEIKQAVLDDKELCDFYLNFSELHIDQKYFIFETSFPINYEIPVQKKPIEYFDDQLIDPFSKIKPQYLEILKSRILDNKTLQEVGDLYKLTRERVRQIESQTVKKLFAFIDRKLIINLLDEVDKYTILPIQNLPIKDETLKLLLIGLLSHKEARRKVIFDQDLMALVHDSKFTFKGLLRKIEDTFLSTTKTTYNKDELIEYLHSIFPQLLNIEDLILILQNKQKLREINNNEYFFHFLYKPKRPMVEFIFSLHPDGIETYKNMNFIKQELDKYFPNVFKDKDMKRGIAALVGFSEHMVLWDWGRYIHTKYVDPILEEFDFSNILDYLDTNLGDTQIDLKFCFEEFKDELESIGIPNRFALHTCLKLKYPDEYSFQDSPWISKAGTERRSLDQTLRNIMTEDRVYTLKELVSAMHSSQIRVQQLIDHSKDVVAVDTFNYKLKKFIDISDDLLQKLTTYANSKVLALEFFYIDLVLDAFSEELEKYNQYDLQTLVLELFKKCSKEKIFNISNTRIVNKDYPVTKDSLNFQVLINNLLTIKESISLNEVSEYFLRRGLSQRLIMSYFLNSKIKTIVRIDRETFTSIEKLGLISKDIETINFLMENSLAQEMILDELIQTLKLPNISSSWNRFILTDIMDNQKFIFTPSRENPIYIHKKD